MPMLVWTYKHAVTNPPVSTSTMSVVIFFSLSLHKPAAAEEGLGDYKDNILGLARKPYQIRKKKEQTKAQAC